MINVALWIFLFLFLAITTILPATAPGSAGSPDTSVFAGQIALMLTWIAFTVYSMYCSYRESLVRTMRKMAALHWGRQIGMDLYLGLIMFCGMIYMVEGSWILALVWLLPTLIYGNLVPLFYAATRLPEISAGF